MRFINGEINWSLDRPFQLLWWLLPQEIMCFNIFLNNDLTFACFENHPWLLMGRNMLAINICSQKVSNHWFCVTMIHSNQLPQVRHLNPVVGPRKNLQRFCLVLTKLFTWSLPENLNIISPSSDPYLTLSWPWSGGES